MKKLIAFFTSSFCLGITGAFAFINLEEPKTVKAEKIEYNINDKTIKTTGKTVITNESGSKVTLLDSYLSNQSNGLSGQANNLELFLGKSGYIKAESATKDDTISISNDAMFTFCHNCDEYGNAWEITSKEIIHNSVDKDFVFYNSVFWIYDIPVFWFPYLSIADGTEKYKTGLLTPSFESTNDMGTQFNIPIYLSISDTHDFTFTPSYLTEENMLFQLEHRLNLPYSEFYTNGSITRNKQGDYRWYIEHDDTIELGDNAKMSIFIERASDNTYLQKYGFYEYEPYLDSGAKLELFGETGYIISEAHVYQELRDTNVQSAKVSGDILPNIYGTYQTKPFYYDTYAVFNTDIQNIYNSTHSSQRFIGDAKIVSPWTLWGGNRVTLNLATRYDLYNFYDTEMLDGEIYSGIKDRFLPSGSIEWGLPLLKSGKSWTYIIEPKANFTVMKQTDDYVFAKNNDSTGAFLSAATLFSDNRFSGLDLWENGTFSDYGVQWSAFDETGQNIDIFIGQSYNFNDINQTDPHSGFYHGQTDYVGRFEYELENNFRIYNRFRLSQENLSLRHSETSLQIGSGFNYLSIGHIWNDAAYSALNPTNQDINEASGGFGFKITDRIGIDFNSVYNIEDDRFQRYMGRISYTHPCYYLALEYQNDNSVKDDYVGHTTVGFKFGISLNGKTFGY